ncbi:MAG: LTA synthase family protein [Planctomycetota bacterium]
MKATQHGFSRSKATLAFLAFALGIPMSARILLLVSRAEELDSSVSISQLLWVGLRLDAVTGGGLTLIVALIALLLPGTPWARKTLAWVGALLLTVLSAAEMAGWFFFQYYDAKPNYLVLEHGSDPEVISAMLQAYPVIRIALASLVLCGAFYWWMRRTMSGADGIMVKDRLTALGLGLLAGFCVRGTFDHRPLNPSYASFSSHRLANEMAANGIFNVLYELAQQSGDTYGNVADITGPLSVEEAFAMARAHLAPTGIFLDGAQGSNPLARKVGDGQARPLNVVVVVMESFTARLGGAWGGELSLTPECDRWASKGLLLEHCIATGERTVQGLEAVLCSFPPLPGVSVIRRPQARDGGFTTLGSMLKSRGYATSFYYGGQGIFDHMKGFFIANGFDTFVEEADFSEVTYKGSWGVCDEDVFLQADRDFDAQHAKGQPFMAAILTVSLHSPWEFPKGKAPLAPAGTEPPPGFDPPELDNFLYADWAVGRFLETASQKPYFNNTVFVFVGDHGVHLRGRELVPLPEYRVVSFILAPGLEPGRLSRPVSQLDLAPTVLGLLGGTWETPFFGRDILSDSSSNLEPWAISIYKKRRYGVLAGHRFLVRSENGDSLCRIGEGKVLEPATMDPVGAQALNSGMGLLLSAEELLKSRRYKAR